MRVVHAFLFFPLLHTLSPPGSGEALADEPAPRIQSQDQIGPETGALLLCGLNAADIRARFLTLAGGAEAKVAVIAARVPSGVDVTAEGPSMARAWGVREVTVWHADDRETAQTESLLTALRAATGVWLTGGRPTHYAELYVGSAAHHELRAVLDRGGVIGGESAGAVIQSTHFVLPPEPRSAPKPAEGFGFLRNVIVFPHVAGESGKFPLSFCGKTISTNAGIVGLCIEDGAGAVVRGRDVEVIGRGTVTVISRAAREATSLTTYKAGERFKLSSDPAAVPGKQDEERP